MDNFNFQPKDDDYILETPLGTFYITYIGYKNKTYSYRIDLNDTHLKNVEFNCSVNQTLKDAQQYVKEYLWTKLIELHKFLFFL